MQTAYWNNHHYWKIMRSIGFSLLIFLALFNLFALLASAAQILLSLTNTDAVAADVVYQLFYAAGYLTVFLLPAFFLKKLIRKTGYPFLPARIIPKLSGWLPLILFAGISVVFAAAYMNAQMIDVLPFVDYSWMYESAESDEWYRVILSFLVICLVPAVCEEILFRGTILTNLLPFGRGNAILISALLFGLMHQNFLQFLYTFCAGIVLGLVYERTRSLWNCILLHMINNTVSLFEDVISNTFRGAFSTTAILIFELVFFGIGIVSAVILIYHFAPKKHSFREGIFEKPVPASDAYAQSPVSFQRRVKGFFNLPMIIFLVISIAEATAVLLMSMFL